MPHSSMALLLSQRWQSLCDQIVVCLFRAGPVLLPIPDQTVLGTNRRRHVESIRVTFLWYTSGSGLEHISRHASGLLRCTVSHGFCHSEFHRDMDDSTFGGFEHSVIDGVKIDINFIRAVSLAALFSLWLKIRF